MTGLLPTELMTIDAYDKTAQTWISKHGGSDFWEAELGRFYTLLPAGKILEIGAGGGRDAKPLIEHGYDYIGTDISTGLLKEVKKALPNHPFYEMSVYDLNFSPRFFDGFWASAVLLHVPKERVNEALARIKSVVKSRGIGFISLKDGTDEKVEADKIGDKTVKRFFAYWQKEEFQKVLEENGFSVVDYTYRPMSEKTRWHCFFVENGGTGH